MANIRIIMDAFGGDNAPGAVIEGAALALGEHKDVSITLAGKRDVIEAELAKYTYDKERLAILDANEVIDCHEQPTLAVKRKRDSSLVRALETVRDGEADAVISAGSTGALLTGATLIVKRLPGVKRPALAPLLPTAKGGYVMLIDCGANSDCKAEYLVQFAVMGEAYMRGVMGIAKPKVALLSNGTEAEKGTELTKAAYKLLLDAPIDFVGNVEARDILSGDFDVLVTDGFTGNVVLKHTEGLASTFMAMLKEGLMSTTRTKLGAALAKPAFRAFKKKMDYKEVGGAAFLGVKAAVVKAHGSSDGRAFASAVGQAVRFVESGVVENIAEGIAALPDAED